MYDKLEQILTSIIYIFFVLALVLVISKNIVNPWIIILLSSIALLSFSIKNIVFHENNRYKLSYNLGIIFDFFIIFVVSTLDGSGTAFIFYLVFLIHIIITAPIKEAAFLTLTSFSLQVITLMISYKYNPQLYVPKALIFSLVFAIEFIAIYILKCLIRQNQIIKNSIKELKSKTLEQQITYNELKDAYEKLEEMTILKERNKIAGEIHDTVGHTLTTVLVEMELGRKLAPQNLNLALEKYSCAQEQVRKGLNELRKSVRMLASGNNDGDFTTSLLALIKDTENHTSVNIATNIGELPQLNAEIQKTFYNALQEGLTNGIKHGKSTAFVFKLVYENPNVIFYLADNGIGCDSVNYGFGLKSMRNRITEIGGSLSIECEPDEGFSLEITLPYNEA